MKVKRTAVFLGVILVLGALVALPATRDELDWWLAQTHDQATDYQRYCADWPKGRHIVEARLLYDKRTWADTKRAMINEALKKHSAAKNDAASINEKRIRKERFFWKQVTVENTVISYQDYLQRYPGGEFADQARKRIDELNRQPAADAVNTNSPGQ